MYKLDENYYYRKCYLKRNQVPTQSIIIDRMKEPLARVYFNSMTPKLKKLAGLEPPLKGGGQDWLIPPQDLLDGKNSLKPTKKEYLTKLGYNGIDFYGEKIIGDHQRAIDEEKRLALLKNDEEWKKTILSSCDSVWQECAAAEEEQNTSMIQRAFRDFKRQYATSMNNIQDMLLQSTITEIENVKKVTFTRMNLRLQELIKHQAVTMYDEYEDKLLKEKDRRKALFVESIEKLRYNLANRLHDINMEKHTAIEKMRGLLECQNLACQVYVALKERRECQKEMDLAKHEHNKRMKDLKEDIAEKDYLISMLKEDEAKCEEFNRIWKKKICHVVKKFQMFVKYCLKALPNYADMFIDMEKLMMMQMSEALRAPSSESLFHHESVTEELVPGPAPKPFILFCDQSHKYSIENQLCLCLCSSTKSLPVIVINKNVIYSACDNFDEFADKITQFISGERGSDFDVRDDHDYKYDIPIKYTSQDKIQEIKLESSLMQVLQQELANLKGANLECCVCKIPYCFCSPLRAADFSSATISKTDNSATPVYDKKFQQIPIGNILEDRIDQLAHEREPKWQSYMDYVMPKSCKCAKMAKHHLKRHMPPYMRNMSPYDIPDLPNYETCPQPVLRNLVKKARGYRTPPPPPPKPEPKTKNVGTQFDDDYDYHHICTCFDDNEFLKVLENPLKRSKIFDKDIAKKQYADTVDGGISTTHLTKSQSSFVTTRACSLKNLIGGEPQLREIFARANSAGCKY